MSASTGLPLETISRICSLRTRFVRKIGQDGGSSDGRALLSVFKLLCSTLFRSYTSSASTSSPSSASSTTRRNNQSVFGNISNGSDDGNPYENGHGQFTADSISESANNDNPYENPNYYNDNGNSRNSSNSNSEDDNPYTNPNYYNDNNQASNNNNDDDEFDGSNYY